MPHSRPPSSSGGRRKPAQPAASPGRQPHVARQAHSRHHAFAPSPPGTQPPGSMPPQVVSQAASLRRPDAALTGMRASTPISKPPMVSSPRSPVSQTRWHRGREPSAPPAPRWQQHPPQRCLRAGPPRSATETAPSHPGGLHACPDLSSPQARAIPSRLSGAHSIPVARTSRSHRPPNRP